MCRSNKVALIYGKNSKGREIEQIIEVVFGEKGETMYDISEIAVDSPLRIQIESIRQNVNAY